MDVGFIGLGHMGAGMARNLMRSGHRLKVWNRSPGPVEALEGEGATRARDPAEAFDAEAVFTMLSADDAVREVVLDTGAPRKARPGLVHVVSATISAGFSSTLEAAHKDAGVAYVAAPVLGRPEVAEAGQLNVLAAGPAEALAKVRPLLDAIGSQVWPMGEAVGVPLPFASVLRDNFVDAIGHGDGDKDWSAVADVAFRRAGRGGG
jgi:3-hydroxyisobutyrate dehydrogenase-like beta-hydroxyacid dehydrogenase